MMNNKILTFIRNGTRREIFGPDAEDVGRALDICPVQRDGQWVISFPQHCWKHFRQHLVNKGFEIVELTKHNGR